jgi:alkylated DNA repair dioxygenase AlkB
MAVDEGVRTWLDATSWVDVHRGWLDAETANALFDAVVADGSGLTWHANRLFKYDHYVEENRLSTMWRPGGPVPHPSIVDIHRRVRHLTGTPFEGPSFNWYRDGNDGQAFHRDRTLRWCEDTVIAILSLGAARPWLMRPRSHRNNHDEAMYKGATLDLRPASGDLLVMGGRCQADWEHSVPPIREPVGARVSVQWRWTSKRGKPEVGADYGAPKHYGRR